MPPPDIDRLLAPARGEGRTALYEHEAYALLEAFGVACPRHAFMPDRATRADEPDGPRPSSSLAGTLAALPGDRVVLKAVAPALLHKTDVGGVRIVHRDEHEVARAIADMRDRLRGAGLVGVLLAEYVTHDAQAGTELLVGVRRTDEFGAVVTVAPGGLHAEFLADRLREEHAIGVLSPAASWVTPRDALRDTAWVQLLVEPRRGATPRVRWDVLSALVGALLRFAGALDAHAIRDCEINPVVVSDGRLVPLDALVTLGHGRPRTLPRPTSKLHQLFAPRHVAVIGVSEQMNPGRLVLRNILRAGFEREAVTVVKPGRDEIDGCRSVPSIGALPRPVDLLVVAVGASQVPAVMDDVLAARAAEAVIVIPGGLEETGGGASRGARVRASLDASRATSWRGPVVIGGNCLGIRSMTGRYDTLFIPETKLPTPQGGGDPLAVIAQSGAFAVARASAWAPLTPRYLVTLGNQVDVSVADVLEWLRDHTDVAVFALYVEGFKPDDGLRTLRAAADLVAAGRSLVLYRAGRTQAGARASQSHTASIAGDYRITRLLFAQAGVMVADTMDAFDDLVTLALHLRDVRTGGRRLAAISNAGFECVAVADGLGSLDLATFGPITTSRLASLFGQLRLDGLVEVHNPLDLTPMTDDAGYEAVVRTVLEDDAVDAAVVGVVPLTAALQTLPASPEWSEDLGHPDGIVARLARVRRELKKPLVVAVDAGARFDPLARALAGAGVPTFRSAVRAVRALDAWTRAHFQARTRH
jgi:acyl-CoA synthetase (NDP forming)